MRRKRVSEGLLLIPTTYSIHLAARSSADPHKPNAAACKHLGSQSMFQQRKGCRTSRLQAKHRSTAARHGASREYLI